MDGAIIKRVGQLAFDIYYYGDGNFENDRDLGRGPGDVRRISMTPEIMRQYLAAHAPELEVVELPEARTTEYISREWKVLPAQVAKTLIER